MKFGVRTQIEMLGSTVRSKSKPEIDISQTCMSYLHKIRHTDRDADERDIVKLLTRS